MTKRYVPNYVPKLTDRQWSVLGPLFPDGAVFMTPDG
jgi:hypothetical protein